MLKSAMPIALSKAIKIKACGSINTATARMASSGSSRNSSHFGLGGRIELSTSFYLSAAAVVAVALVIRWRGRKLLRP